MKIRKLEVFDNFSRLFELCREFFLEYESHHAEFFDTDNLSDDDISGRFLKSIDSDDSATLIALVDDEIVGYVMLEIRNQPHFYKVKKVGAIPALMVARLRRREGIGTRLLEASRDWFREKGIRYFTFYTSVANEDAIRLYEKIGMSGLQLVFLGET